MNSPDWYYRESIEHELERLGASSWRYQDDRAQFRDEQQAVSGDVELISDVYGAILGAASDVQKTLERLRDGVGDASIAEALFGHDEGGGDASR